MVQRGSSTDLGSFYWRVRAGRADQQRGCFDIRLSANVRGLLGQIQE